MLHDQKYKLRKLLTTYETHKSALPSHRLSLSTNVDLKKLRFFSVPHDGGSPLLSPVDPQLIQAQKKVCVCIHF